MFYVYKSIQKGEEIMNENKEFKPYIPADKITPEFTVTSIIMGVILAELACNVDSGSGGAYFIDRYFRIHVDFRFLIEYPDIARIDPCDRYCGG